jgi:protein-tyrosine phosphatase
MSFAIQSDTFKTHQSDTFKTHQSVEDSQQKTPSLNSSSQYEYRKKLPLTKIIDNIFVGAIDLCMDIDKLVANNICYILNLTNSQINIKNSNINVFNFPLSSKTYCSLMNNIPKCIEYIDLSTKSNGNILICCRDGISRAFVVMCAYYILKYNKNYKSVSHILKTKSHIDIVIGSNYEKYLNQMHNVVTRNTPLCV